MALNPSEKNALLRLAREAIAAKLGGGKPPVLTEPTPGLAEHRGAFVTIYKKGKLRGCIGELETRRPLWEAVAAMAPKSASDDPRFAAMAPGELDGCRIEISALTPLERIQDPGSIRLGTDGVYVVGRSAGGGQRTGCFLPQVAARTGWDCDQFLSILCREKAALAEDAWKDPETEIYIFQADVFGEE